VEIPDVVAANRETETTATIVTRDVSHECNPANAAFRLELVLLDLPIMIIMDLKPSLYLKSQIKSLRKNAGLITRFLEGLSEPNKRRRARRKGVHNLTPPQTLVHFSAYMYSLH
jgi:hypothetical protein